MNVFWHVLYLYCQTPDVSNASNNSSYLIKYYNVTIVVRALFRYWLRKLYTTHMHNYSKGIFVCIVLKKKYISFHTYTFNRTSSRCSINQFQGFYFACLYCNIMLDLTSELIRFEFVIRTYFLHDEKNFNILTEDHSRVLFHAIARVLDFFLITY